MPNRAIFLALSAILALPLFSAAQDLPSENVTVLKNFEAQLLDAERIDLSPELPQVDTVRTRQMFRIPARDLVIDYPPPTIRPYGMRSEKPADPYHGFLRAGGGFPNAIYGDASYRYLFEDRLNLGLRARHHSANFKKLENQRFSDTDAGLDAAYYFKEGFAVNAGLGYSLNNVSFYGYNQDEDFQGIVLPDDVRQRFSNLRFNGGLFNGERTVGDFNYRANLDAYFLNDNFAAKEQGADLQIGGTKWFNGKHSLDVLLRTDFTFFKDTATQKLHNFFLVPAFTFHASAFKAKIGVNMANHKDEFSFFPDVLVSANILGSQLAAFAGADGTLQKNTFEELTSYNPFLVSRINLRNTRIYHFFAGVKGSMKTVEYSGQVGYKRADDLALFLLDENPLIPSHRRFNVLYDTATIFNVQGSVALNLVPRMQITGTVSQNIYTMRNEEKAWHLPIFTFNGGAQYTTLKDKLVVRGEVYLENGVPFRNAKGDAENLNALFDVSLGAEYFFSKNFGAFAKVNNLADNQRQRWQYYPTYGINALAGISARF